MKRSEYRITLELGGSYGACRLDMKRSDTFRRIYMEFTDGGKPYPVSDGCSAIFLALKPDKTAIYNVCRIENGAVVYDITPQTTTVPGAVHCEVRIYDGQVTLEPDEWGDLYLPQEDVHLLTSATFTVFVHDTVYNGQALLESRGEVTMLDTLVTEATAAIAEARAIREARDAGEFRGEKGDQGEQGPQGEKGEKGEKGDPGTALIDDTAVRADAAWSAKNILDKLCPTFEKSGTLVHCEPVEGYPLTVQLLEGLDGTKTVAVCGKNLYNREAYPLSTDGYPYSGESNLGMFAKSNTYKRTGFIPVPHLRGQRIVLSHPPEGTNPGMSFYTRRPNVDDSADCKDAWCGGTTGAGMVVPEEATYMVFCVKAADADKDVQIELGSISTDYEPYRESVKTDLYTVDFPIEIPAVAGINAVYGYDDQGEDELVPCSISVTGKADPVAIIEKLTNAVISLGGNV